MHHKHARLQRKHSKFTKYGSDQVHRKELYLTCGLYDGTTVSYILDFTPRSFLQFIKKTVLTQHIIELDMHNIED